MILYHGSNVAVSAIQLSKCRPNKDFGRGFYTTTFIPKRLKWPDVLQDALAESLMFLLSL
jgi:hypothetical protein